MEILVFKTNITTPLQKRELQNLMNGIQNVDKWNLDIWDIDNVLRIESQMDCSLQIVQQLTKAGLECAPLED